MSKVVFFLDIDDCLIKTSRLLPVHLSTLKNSLNKLAIDHASEITEEFASSFNKLFDRHQGIKLDQSDLKLLSEWEVKARELEKPIIAKFGQIKKWSREVFIYLAALKFGVKISNTNLIYTTNHLWSNISQTATYYPDTLPFFKSLQDKKIPIYLITSSDCRLTLDDKTGLFHYDPEFSRKLKLARLKRFVDLGIPAENIFIGDPYDKPNPWVFRLALEKAKKDLKNKKFTSIMIGDSVTNDLLPAKKAGMDFLFLINRNTNKEKQSSTDGITIINQLVLQMPVC